MPDPTKFHPRLLVGALALAGLAPALCAQSFNVDVQGFGMPLPPATCGGPARSPGVWNSGWLSTGLVDLNGGPTNAVFDDTIGCPGDIYCDDPATPSPDGLMLDDYQRCDTGGIACGFSNLANGTYVVYSTVFRPCAAAPLQQVDVLGSLSGPENVTAVWNGAYARGENFARHTLTVGANYLVVVVSNPAGGSLTLINGIQLIKLNETDTLAQCFGDGSAAPCPCGNNGVAGHGCENSAATGGAQLYASGAIAPDSMILRSEGELPGALSIFLQGNATITPIVFGDGLRCTGGLLKRLYVKSASHGLATAPDLGDPSITQRSAALGDPIPSGDRRYYQVYYRDPDASFCPSPAGNTFNVGNSLRIVW
jgi:hypothetical protein